jgi:hypothetical protein
MTTDKRTVVKSVRVNEKLWHDCRVKALSERKSMQDLIEELLIKYLGKRGGK